MRFMRIFMFMVCIHGVQPLSVNYFTSTGNMKQGIFISLSRQGFLFVPLLIILPRLFGLDGVLFSAPIADALACILALSLVFRNFRTFNKEPKL